MWETAEQVYCIVYLRNSYVSNCKQKETLSLLQNQTKLLTGESERHFPQIYNFYPKNSATTVNAKCCLEYCSVGSLGESIENG